MGPERELSSEERLGPVIGDHDHWHTEMIRG
jgi:hypothetical protein